MFVSTLEGADGLGNPKENALPVCQLERLRDRCVNLNQARDTRVRRSPKMDNQVYLWMDTLCIPVHPSAERHRKKAIRLLGKTFHEAAAVLVVDRELDYVESATSSFLELGMRILCSGWMKRLWTTLA